MRKKQKERLGLPKTTDLVFPEGLGRSEWRSQGQTKETGFCIICRGFKEVLQVTTLLPTSHPGVPQRAIHIRAYITKYLPLFSPFVILFLAQLFCWNDCFFLVFLGYLVHSLCWFN